MHQVYHLERSNHGQPPPANHARESPNAPTVLVDHLPARLLFDECNNWSQRGNAVRHSWSAADPLSPTLTGHVLSLLFFAELQEADPEGTDPDFAEAVVENRGVIKNKQFEVAAIENIIKKNFPHAYEDLKPGKVFTPPAGEGEGGKEEPPLVHAAGPAFELDDDGGMLM